MKLTNSIVVLKLRRRPLRLIGLSGLFLAAVGFTLGLMSMHPIHLHIFGWTWLFQALVASYLVIIGSILMLIAILLVSMNRIMRKNWPSA